MTKKTICGQSFDGTSNVSGTLSEVGNINFKVDNSYDIGSNAAASRYIYTNWLGARSGRKLELGANNSGLGQGLCIDTNLNVGIGTNSPAYKLHVVGDIYSTANIRTILKDKAIILSDSDDPAWISAIAGQIVFDTGKAIRFGETDWNFNKWAGLKYTHSNKTIYLGIADGTAFTAISPQNDGTLKFPGITTITPDAAARIGGSGGDLYLGNGNNSNWVKVQDMCSQVNSSYWNITQNGSATFKSLTVTEGSLKIGGIYLSYDSANNALRLSKDAAGKEAANFYATGGITAYGAGASTTGGGGGLNGSVKSYSNALKLTSESLSEIASAYSIKALDSRISSLEGGSATAISVSGSGNAVTSVTKNGTTISVVKGSTFLTSHQSLDGYVNAISVSGSGNAITSVSKSGKGITFTKGATFLTSHQSLANYYTKSSVDSLLSGKSATSHTHSVKINGVTKTIAATGGTAVDLGTYLTSHQSLADYAKKSEIPTKVSQLTNDTGYITSSGSCAYATSAGNADKVDGVHVTWAGVLTSTSHLVAWESDGSALRDINPANVTVGNSDKLDGIHANGLLTALSNSDKGISITVGGTTKSIFFFFKQKTAYEMRT